jgi:hypothetical protein
MQTIDIGSAMGAENKLLDRLECAGKQAASLKTLSLLGGVGLQCWWQAQHVAGGGFQRPPPLPAQVGPPRELKRLKR